MNYSEVRKEKKKPAFQTAVLRWSKSNTRWFPWRSHSRSSYEILVAELLLKRTTATAAASIYETFLMKYPSIDVLSNASEGQLAQDLEGVGLYRQRARATYRLAQYLVDFGDGRVPATLSDLLKVPGIGEYSARAILSFGYGRPAAVVDNNVVRVLGRVFQDLMPEHPSPGLLQELADTLLPERGHREFNFGLLDLGALVCRNVRPHCNSCPLRDICDYASSREYPSPKKESTVPRLRELRTQRNLSLLNLAEKAQVSKLTIINIEAGRTKPRPATLKKLAEALEVTLASLMSIDERADSKETSPIAAAL